MAEYLHPGVYVEEVDAGPSPIAGVSTSTAGAVGVTERGPTSDKPVLCTSFADFERTFGGFLPVPQATTNNRWDFDTAEGGRWWLFPLSVKGFFDNGGQRLYVKRVFAAPDPANNRGAVASSAALVQGLVAGLAADADAGANSKQVRLVHTIGVAVGGKLNFFTAGVTPIAGNPYTVAGYDASGTVTLATALQADLRAGRDLVAIFPRSAAPITPAKNTVSFTAKSLGKWGDAVSVRMRPMVGATLAVLADPATGGPAASAHLTKAATGTGVLLVDSTTNFAANDNIRVLGRDFKIVTVDSATQLTVTPAVAAAVTWPVGTTITRLRPAGNGTQMHLANTSALYDYAVLEFDDGANKEVVGQVAAELRSLRPPEPYKGKGIKYVGEQVRRKAGKAGGK